MTADPAPDYGGRFQLDRIETDGERARYRADVRTDEATYSYSVDIRIVDGAVDIQPTHRAPVAAPDPPPWLSGHLLKLARQLSRNGLRSGDWPRRIRRWRDV